MKLALLIILLLPVSVRATEDVWPTESWLVAKPADVGMDAGQLIKARDYALTGAGAGYVIRHGKLVMSWGDAKRQFDLKSTTKSIGITAVGLAVADGKLKLDDLITQHHSEFIAPDEDKQQSDWKQQITLQHLATQTAGFDKPGGYTKLLFQAGAKWSYSDCGPNWLAECVTLAYQRDIQDLLFDRVFAPIGIARKDLAWRLNSYRPKQINGITRREFGSGISANVNAMARIGYLYLHGGKWDGKRILPKDFVAKATSTVDSVVGLPELDSTNYGNASDHYGLLWWNNADGTLANVPRDSYWAWGLHESLILVIPSLDIVVARAGKGWNSNWAGHYDVLQPFFAPIVASVKDASQRRRADDLSSVVERQVTSKNGDAPYPRSDIIKRIEWAPADTVIRKARGSDNWPLTWGADDTMYTAYGDGYGFKPYVERKLSLGLSRVTGEPANFVGSNLRAATAERTGQGANGPKASGLLMVDGVLYMLVRNVRNSTLAWSDDRGQTWTWSDWTFETSLGCPTFLNFGRNYEGARDEFVYVYSQDSDSAYERANRMVMARVPTSKIRDRTAYQFFCGFDDGHPHLHQRHSAAGRRLQTCRKLLSLRRHVQCGDRTLFVVPDRCWRGHPVQRRIRSL